MAKDKPKNKAERPSPEPAETKEQAAAEQTGATVEPNPFEDLIRQTQETILAGARGLQQAYRSVLHSPLIRDTRSQIKDPKHAIVGAGFGAGVGLGLSIILRVHPIGRALMVAAGAGCGALIATREEPQDDDGAKDEASPEDKGELV